MKTTAKKLLSFLLLLAIFIGTVSCRPQTDVPEESSGTVDPTDPNAALPNAWSVVYPDGTSTGVRNAARKLKAELEDICGGSVELLTDAEQPKTAKEIIVGNTARGIPDGKTVAETEYRIFMSDNRLYVLGGSNGATVDGIYHLLLNFDRWQTEMSSLDVTGAIGDSVLNADNIRDFDILLPGSDTVGLKCANHIRAKIKEFFGVELEIARLTGSKKENHIIIGDIGTKGSIAVSYALSDREFAVKTELDGSNINIYIAGYNDTALWRGAVYFYDQCITREGFEVPVLMNVKIKPNYVRDPHILEVDGTYYLYVNMNDKGWGAYTSTDLVNWSSECTVVCNPFDGNSPAFDGVADLWAPEVHEYHGKYYMFVTYRRADAKPNPSGFYYRVAGIFKADSPLGPFVLHSNGPVVPYDGMLVDGATVADADTWSVIDATLYVDENDDPWIVFSHEWVSLNNGGTFCAARLSEDLSHIEGEIHTLFNTYDGYQSNEAVTDAAYLYRTSSGQLLLLWSNYDSVRQKGYRVYIARSVSGNVLGSWTHDEVYLYEKDMDTIYSLFDGGHPCIIKDGKGQLWLGIHSRSLSDESLNLIPIRDTGTTLEIEKYR